MERGVGDGQLESISEDAQLGLGELLGLVGDIARLNARTKCPALGRLGQHNGRCAEVLGRGAVCGVDLAVVVAAAPEPGQVFVGEILGEPLEARVRAEEMLPNVGPARHRVLLELAVDGLVHLVDENTVDVPGEQVVPLAGPDNLDHVPAGAAEKPFQLLDDLAVAPDRTVKTLQIAVDDEGQVVEAFASRHGQCGHGLGLVHLTVAEEGPDPACRRVGQASIGQVSVQAGLIDRGDGADAHRDGRKFPEVRLGARVGVARQANSRERLLTEVVEILLSETPLQKGSGVHAGGGVALEEDLITGTTVVLAPEEVIEAHLVERGGAGVCRQMAADSGCSVVGP